MKQYALALIASVASLSTYAQNLVPNPSFEEYLECPQSTGELDQQVVDWVSWSITPDFFQVCNNLGLGTAGVPDNFLGIQSPILGDAYAGLFTYADYETNAREYMAAQLNEPLAVGESYYVVFHASMCDFSEKINRLCATNNLGLRFFKDPNYTAFPPDANPLQPDNFAHINYSEILSDSINWIAIDGWFTADDSYDWIAIGNFFTDSETETEVLNDSELCSGVYYIENVCVGSSQSDCEYLLSEKNRGEQIFGSLFPNPATNVVTLQIDTRGFFDVEITDLQGRVLLRYNEVRNGDVFDVSSFQKGIYVVRVSNDKYFSSFKLFIT